MDDWEKRDMRDRGSAGAPVSSIGKRDYLGACPDGSGQSFVIIFIRKSLLGACSERLARINRRIKDLRSAVMRRREGVELHVAISRDSIYCL